MGYDYIQTTLSGESPEEEFFDLLNSSLPAMDRLEQIKWDFSGFKTQYLTHRFHSYPARFIPQIPLSFIRLFTRPRDTVLDPFCGCGTTLVEALLNNRNSIGVDLNPLATLISKTKVTLVPDDELQFLQQHLASLHSCEPESQAVKEWLGRLPNRKLSKLFDELTISRLETIRKTLMSLKNGHRDLFDIGCVALSETIWSLVENGGVKDVSNHFANRINLMVEELKAMNRLVRDRPNCRVINGDARNLDLVDETIDLVVTSPPYVNALDYYRIHMYNMLWLGMDFGIFKKQEIGAHSHFIANRFRLLSQYLADMLRSMIEMNRVLKTDGICAIVVGNSSLEYELIESHRFFASMARRIGFEVKKTLFRNIDTTRKYTSSNIGNIDEEYILVLQKERSAQVISTDDDFVIEIVMQEMKSFQRQINETQGTSISGRKPSEARLKDNIERIADAIENLSKDIRMNV